MKETLTPSLTKETSVSDVTSETNKLDIAKVRERLSKSQGKAYWLGLEELSETDEFREFLNEEFPRQAVPYESSVDRRDFLKLLGASMALAGLTSCVRPVRPNEKIVPYVKAPEEMIPGRPLFFASAMTQGGYAMGVIAESHQGRPTRVEGNPDHPASLGAMDVTTAASVLGLYDPDRSQAITGGADFAAFATALQGAASGNGFAILTETVTSPTLARQLAQVFEAYPNTKWYQYDQLHNDNAFTAAQQVFGEAVTTRYDFSQADVIVSLGADFLGEGPARIRYTKDFSRRRKVLSAEDTMSRLYVMESHPSITGAKADHRVTVRPSQIAAIAGHIAAEIGVNGAEGALPEGVNAELVEALISDLQATNGRSIVIAGDGEAPYVHAIAHALNDVLGNIGSTVFYHESVEVQAVNHSEQLSALVDDINSGTVTSLLVLGANPVYTAPVDLNFQEAYGKLTSFHVGQYFDETAQVSTWHVPQTHYLETWSDARAFDGTVTIMQPLISPFYNGKSDHEILAALLGNAEATSFEIVQDTYRANVSGDFDDFWRQSVFAGVIAGTQAPLKGVTFGSLPEAPAAPAGEFEITFKLDPSLLDGRYANNGWLQEAPKPLTKIVWDNVAFIAPATAETLGVSNHDVVTLTVGENTVNAPVWVMPGQAANTITVHLGFGRGENAGHTANGVGFNANVIRTSENPWHASATVAKAAGRHKVVTTQIHWRYDSPTGKNETWGDYADGTTERRHIVRHGTLAALQAEPDHPHFVHPVAHHESDLYPDYAYDSYKWGMVVDMTACTGCNACVVACQSENNIPVVGKKQVAVGREMHWIRIDTYYGGDLENPDFYFQPVACMQCEKAPCEPVCPVGATVHDNEGLNVMVYNRCVGTRYCSNNCPYKVRRYNFLQYAELTTTATELSLMQNPDVTVRSRGVMEKCTFCTQRIQQAYIRAENQGRKIADGEAVTACQSACPAEAIVFGDMNTEGALVNSHKESVLNYALLEELNTKPRLTYLAKVSNPHPSLVAETEAHS
jgi:molybdopterin-containing oxidoreductase family iron-sulfur binding subunit